MGYFHGNVPRLIYFPKISKKLRVDVPADRISSPR